MTTNDSQLQENDELLLLLDDAATAAASLQVDSFFLPGGILDPDNDNDSGRYDNNGGHEHQQRQQVGGKAVTDHADDNNVVVPSPTIAPFTTTTNHEPATTTTSLDWSNTITGTTTTTTTRISSRRDDNDDGRRTKKDGNGGLLASSLPSAQWRGPAPVTENPWAASSMPSASGSSYAVVATATADGTLPSRPKTYSDNVRVAKSKNDDKKFREAATAVSSSSMVGTRHDGGSADTWWLPSDDLQQQQQHHHEEQQQYTPMLPSTSHDCPPTITTSTNDWRAFVPNHHDGGGASFCLPRTAKVRHGERAGASDNVAANHDTAAAAAEIRHSIRPPPGFSTAAATAMPMTTILVNSDCGDESVSSCNSSARSLLSSEDEDNDDERHNFETLQLQIKKSDDDADDDNADDDNKSFIHDNDESSSVPFRELYNHSAHDGAAATVSTTSSLSNGSTATNGNSSSSSNRMDSALTSSQMACEPLVIPVMDQSDAVPSVVHSKHSVLKESSDAAESSDLRQCNITRGERGDNCRDGVVTNTTTTTMARRGNDDSRAAACPPALPLLLQQPLEPQRPSTSKPRNRGRGKANRRHKKRSTKTTSDQTKAAACVTAAQREQRQVSKDQRCNWRIPWMDWMAHMCSAVLTYLQASLHFGGLAIRVLCTSAWTACAFLGQTCKRILFGGIRIAGIVVSISSLVCRHAMLEVVQHPRVAVYFAIAYGFPHVMALWMRNIVSPYWTPHLVSYGAVAMMLHGRGHGLQPSSLYLPHSEPFADETPTAPRVDGRRVDAKPGVVHAYNSSQSRQPPAATETPTRDDSNMHHTGWTRYACRVLVLGEHILLRWVLPIMLCAQGLSHQYGPLRLVTAYIMIVTRLGLLQCSPMAWLCGGIQVLVATHLLHCWMLPPIVGNIIFLFVGLASIRFVCFLRQQSNHTATATITISSKREG